VGSAAVLVEQAPEHAPFQVRRAFIECAFQRRYLGLLDYALANAAWLVIGGLRGSGKSWGIADFVARHAGVKQSNGDTRLPVLDIRTPRARTERALGAVLCAGLGTVRQMPWDFQRRWLVGALADVDLRLLLIDDAHGLSLEQLSYLKELFDNLAAQPYQRQVGLCLISATERGLVPLRETLEQHAGAFWDQFRRRLDKTRPYCLVLGHTLAEVAEILAGYEDLYRPQFPDLRLVPWTRTIYDLLTHQLFDPDGSKRVTMDTLAGFIRLVLESARALGWRDIQGSLLTSVADLMIIGRERLTEIDGEPTPRPHLMLG